MVHWIDSLNSPTMIPKEAARAETEETSFSTATVEGTRAGDSLLVALTRKNGTGKDGICPSKVLH